MLTANPKKIEILLLEDNGVDVDLISEHLELSKLDFNISIATRLTDGIEQRAVLSRLQTVVPAGTPRGALSL